MLHIMSTYFNKNFNFCQFLELLMEYEINQVDKLCMTENVNLLFIKFNNFFKFFFLTRVFYSDNKYITPSIEHNEYN